MVFDPKTLVLYPSEPGVYLMKDAEGKISDEIKKGVEEKVKELKDVKDKDDLSAIKTATENLSKEIQKIGEYMQKNPGAASAGSSGEPKSEDQKPPEENK